MMNKFMGRALSAMHPALCLLGAMLLGPSFPAEAQQTKKIPRIGYLSFDSRLLAADEAFRQGLRQLGYVEEQNIAIEYRFAHRRGKRRARLAVELVGLQVDVIVTTTGQGARDAKEGTGTIPIVMASSGDAVRQGIVASLARPGGNVTGLTAVSPNLSGKRLELLKEAFPRVTRVGALGCQSGLASINDEEWSETRVAARPLRVQLESISVGRQGELTLEAAFAAAIKKRVEALVIFDCPPVFWPRKTVDLAAKRRLPTMYPFGYYVEEFGGLMAYGPNKEDMFRRAASYVDKILRGVKPSELPVEQPTKFELVINLKTAKENGLIIPSEMLMWADKVIK
jgi:putative ABC transport system substrate-binding protein